MFDDDLEPKTKKPAPKNLDPISIDELESYIEDLQNEITRARAEIDKKNVFHAAADSVFKT